MSDNGSQSAYEQVDAFTRMWGDFATKMMSAGFAAAPGSAPPEAVRQVRAAMLQAMSQQCEQFMRSPAFLEMMKQTLEATVGLRSQLNQMLQRVHHETQGVARDDVDNLMLTIRHFEGRVLDRLDELEQRVNALSGGKAEPVSPRTQARKPQPKARQRKR